MNTNLLFRRTLRLLRRGSVHSADYCAYIKFLGGKPEDRLGPVVNFTIDFELAWSRARRGNSCLSLDEALMRSHAARQALPVLLDLAGKFSIPITFALVGHVATRSCADHQTPPPFVPFWVGKDWFSIDPKTDISQNTDYYGLDLVEKILECSVSHEIASHGFSHVDLADETTIDSIARFEIFESRRILTRLGRPVTTFVFPKNHPGRFSMLRECGFTVYRNNRQQSIKRDEFGLWQFPLGLWLSPLAASSREIINIIEIAAKRGILANFWCHLFEFRTARDVQHYFEPIFYYIAVLRSRGLAVLTIQDIINSIEYGGC